MTVVPQQAADPNLIAAELRDYVARFMGRDPRTATKRDWYYALAYFLRGRLSEARIRSWRRNNSRDAKWVYYLSLELLPGKMLRAALVAHGLEEACRKGLADAGINLDDLWDYEIEPALGNGGLGRLAACLLESMATLGFAALGYCIRYEYGMFRQDIEDGQQVEYAENWLKNTNPWEFPRPDFVYPVHFEGQVQQVSNWKGQLDVHWTGGNSVIAMAYDMPIVGADANSTGMVRLWSAKATSDFNLDYFNRGDYLEAVEDKAESETLSRVLYPSDTTASGRELRLKQEYFLVCASLQDILWRFLDRHSSLELLPEKVAIQLNDTHPVLAVAELMRLLVDGHNLPWEKAWDLTTRTIAFTNHTLLSESLEAWPVSLIDHLLPRHLQIIYEINARFLRDVMHSNPGDTDLLRRMSLIDETGGRRVRMAHLAIVGSHKVNGVSATHTAIMRETLFGDFDKLWPGKIINLTNGISPRRWLTLANPDLDALIGSKLGETRVEDFTRLDELQPLTADPEFRTAFSAIKLRNKERLAHYLAGELGVTLDPHSMFDLHVKRIHEYKRQLLNVLHVIARYNRIRAGDRAGLLPRTVIFSGKAAPGYDMAKRIIHLITSVADVVNNDPAIGDLLKIVFVPNYDVTLAEILIPAGDLSEQISTAGTEASGTGNMKLALNGALTIATKDGANNEIADAVGRDNIWMFGHTFEELQIIRQRPYNPRAIYESTPEVRQTLDMIRNGYFSPHDKTLFAPIVDSIVNGDNYMLLADYDDYMRAQKLVDLAYLDQLQWVQKAIINVSRMAPFSADRLVGEYALEVWGAKPVPKVS